MRMREKLVLRPRPSGERHPKMPSSIDPRKFKGRFRCSHCLKFREIRVLGFAVIALQGPLVSRLEIASLRLVEILAFSTQHAFRSR